MDAMTTAPLPTHTLNDGLELPAIGFGTWPLRGDDAVAAVRSALDVGYRLLDTAVNYENEAEVGRAVRESAVPRAEILVQTKVPGRFHARDLAIRSVEDSLRRMHLDVLDLVLVHWPNPEPGALCRGRRGAPHLPRARAGPLRGRLQPHRATAGRSHRGHRLHTERQPGRAAPPFPRPNSSHDTNPSASGPRRGARWPAWNPRGR